MIIPNVSTSPSSSGSGSNEAGRPGEEGQSLVLIALVMVGLLTMAALLIDGGTAYAQRRRAQNAADAGSIAGARQVALGATDSQVNAAIREYTVTRNGATTYTATYYPGGQTVGGGTVPGNATGVQVTVHITFPTFFAPIFGQTQTTVASLAGGSFGGVTTPGPSLQPLARKCLPGETTLSECGFVYGQPYDIWQGGGSGNFGWLSWNGDNSAGNITNELIPGSTSLTGYSDPHGACTAIAVGCWVEGQPGVSNSSSIGAQLDQWKALGAQTPPTPMIIVIYNTSETNGSNNNYHIVGFSAFILQSYDLPGKSVTGKFIQWVVGAPVNDGGGQYGVVAPHLIPAATPTP